MGLLRKTFFGVFCVEALNAMKGDADYEKREEEGGGVTPLTPLTTISRWPWPVFPHRVLAAGWCKNVNINLAIRELRERYLTSSRL